ncbi:MAG: hypothetical protein HC811_04380 [Flammeovirgaceae bacterium]|nr:hypothetical protein [Flammeovirgaceae bacterium]
MKRFILLLSILTFTSGAFAQDDIDAIVKGSLSDANYLLQGYITPVMDALGGGLNQGWYNTAKAHKPLGLDLTVSASLMYVPSAEKLYNVDNNILQEITLISYDGQSVSPTGSGNVPTIFGPDKTPTYELDIDGTQFDGPAGVDLQEAIKFADALPVPIYNFGIGLPKGTDLKVRWSPRLTLDDLEFNIFGLAVMHDIKQYIPGIKSLPFDLSAFVGYMKLKSELAISTDPTENQTGVMELSATTVQALISKKYPC